MWIYVESDGRITCYNAAVSMEGTTGWVLFEGELPDNYTDYRLVNGALVYDPLPEIEPEPVPDYAGTLIELMAIIDGEEE